MKSTLCFYLGICLTLGISGCSPKEPADGEHFMSGQQRALEKAKNLNAEIQAAQDKKRQEFEKAFRDKSKQD